MAAERERRRDLKQRKLAREKKDKEKEARKAKQELHLKQDRLRRQADDRSRKRAAIDKKRAQIQASMKKNWKELKTEKRAARWHIHSNLQDEKDLDSQHLMLEIDEIMTVDQYLTIQAIYKHYSQI